jgi:hypothetical protein
VEGQLAAGADVDFERLDVWWWRSSALEISLMVRRVLCCSRAMGNRLEMDEREEEIKKKSRKKPSFAPC